MASPSQVESSSSPGSRRRRGPRSAYLEQACGGDSAACGSGWNSCWKPTRKTKDFLAEPAVDRDPFEVVAESFLARFRAGQRPSIEDLADRHADVADQIRELLPALVRLEKDLMIDHDPGSNGPQAPPPPAPGADAPAGRLPHPSRDRPGRDGGRLRGRAGQPGPPGALEVLPSQVAEDRLALEWFRREAKSAARLHHSNIVPVYEVGRDGEVAYYAMQFIEGQGLDKVIDELARLRDPGRKPDIAQGPGPTARRVARCGEPALAGSQSRSSTAGSRRKGPCPPPASCRPP